MCANENNMNKKKTGKVPVNFTLRLVRLTIVAMEEQLVLHILIVCL